MKTPVRPSPRRPSRSASRSIAFAALAASLVAAAGGAGLVCCAHARHVAIGSVASRASAPRITWEKGVEYTYDLGWSSDATVRAPGMILGDGKEPLRGNGRLEGELALRVRDVRDGVALVAARFTSVRALGLSILGREAFEDASARAPFESEETLVEIDPHGTVQSMRFARSAPPLYRQMMLSVLTGMSLQIADGAAERWTTTEPAPSGRAQVRYERSDGELLRTRTTYDVILSLPADAAKHGMQDLASRSRIVVDDGTLTSIADDESLAVRPPADAGVTGEAPWLESRAHFALRLEGKRRFDALPLSDAALADLDTLRPGEPTVPPVDAEHMKDAQLAGDMTLDTMIDRLGITGVTGIVPRGFVTHAAALLRLHPEVCDELAARVADPDLGPRGRELLADLLASAGDPRAQAALRRVLEAPEAQSDAASYRRMLQRFSFVRAPDAATVRWLTSRYAERHAANDVPSALASAYTLGATAGNLASNGDRAGAGAIVQTLARDLESAKTADEKRGLVDALGNAGLPEVVGTLRPYLRGDDARLRRDAAGALRKVSTPEARDALVDLVNDADPDVARAALASLDRPSMDEEGVRRVAALAPTLPADAAPNLVTFLAQHREPRADVDRALQATAARAVNDPETQARVAAILASPPAQ